LPGADFFPSIAFRVHYSVLVDVWARACAAVAKWISSTAIMTSNDLSSKFGPLPRVLTWAKRYGAAEVTGTLTAYLGYFRMLGMTQNDVASAYGGSISESLGFFGVMIIREIAADRSQARRRLESYGWKGMHCTIRGLFWNSDRPNCSGFDRSACNGHCFILPWTQESASSWASWHRISRFMDPRFSLASFAESGL
jgi:hypothetical protein